MSVIPVCPRFFSLTWHFESISNFACFFFSVLELFQVSDTFSRVSRVAATFQNLSCDIMKQTVNSHKHSPVISNYQANLLSDWLYKGVLVFSRMSTSLGSAVTKKNGCIPILWMGCKVWCFVIKWVANFSGRAHIVLLICGYTAV